MCHYQIAYCQWRGGFRRFETWNFRNFLAKKPASSQRTMSSSALFLSSATPVSGLPVVVFAPATPQIDSDAPPELDSRVSRVLAEPIANPARARTVEEEAPMDGRETAASVFFVPFQVFHSMESNSAPANAAPDLSDQVAINERVRSCIDLTLDSDVEFNIVTTDSEDRANGATTEEEDGVNRGASTEDDGEAYRAEQRRILVEKEIFCAQPRDDDEVEPPQWPLEQVVVVFGVEGIFEAIRGRKPKPTKPKVDWYKVGRAPQAGSASARFKDRYPVRRGRAKRDHGEMRELLSDNCEDESAEEEPEESDGMIDDTDSEEGYADFAMMLAREREAEKKAAEAAEKKAAKAAEKKAAKKAAKKTRVGVRIGNEGRRLARSGRHSHRSPCRSRFSPKRPSPGDTPYLAGHEVSISGTRRRPACLPIVHLLCIVV